MEIAEAAEYEEWVTSGQAEWTRHMKSNETKVTKIRDNDLIDDDYNHSRRSSFKKDNFL